MSGRRARQFVIVVAIAAGIAALFWSGALSPMGGKKSARPVPPPVKAAPLTTVPAPAEAPIEGESHLADDLNAPGGTIQRDLEILNELFSTWQTNFPRTGNPVGENVEITAALTGANDLRFAFISRRHRAINANGELCDRWGMPFRFHQLSGHQMEIRSAGPDRRFGTDDDAAWTPPP